MTKLWHSPRPRAEGSAPAGAPPMAVGGYLMVGDDALPSAYWGCSLLAPLLR